MDMKVGVTFINVLRIHKNEDLQHERRHCCKYTAAMQRNRYLAGGHSGPSRLFVEELDTEAVRTVIYCSFVRTNSIYKRFHPMARVAIFPHIDM